MNYTFVGKNITITEGIKGALENKLAKIDKYFEGENANCRAVARTYPIGTKLEITIFTPHMDFRAEVTNPDLYCAMDEAIEKLEGQMRKLKTRMDRRNKPSLGEAIALEKKAAEEAAKENDEIVRTKSIYLEPMTLDEAINRMEALDHDFFIYLDSDEDRIAVVYRRLNGGYGVIEAENKIK